MGSSRAMVQGVLSGSVGWKRVRRSVRLSWARCLMAVNIFSRTSFVRLVLSCVKGWLEVSFCFS